MTSSNRSSATLGLLGRALVFGVACGGSTGTGTEAPEVPDLPPLSASEQKTCTVGQLAIVTQADLDALEGCTTIVGSVYVVPRSGSIDLQPLAQLRSVEGQFSIGCDPFAGLEADCRGMSEAAVTSLEGLNALEEASRLQLARLPVPSLAPLARLRRVGFLGISAMPVLTQLTGLGKLEQLETLELLQNPDLESLDGLARPAALASLVLEGNPALVDIGVLAGATSKLQRVALNGVPVEDLSPLGGLAALDDLSIGGTRARSFDGLALRNVRRLYVHGNALLEQVDALGRLESFGDMTFIDNPRLTRLPEFNVDTFSSFDVFFNAALSEGPAFPALIRNRSVSVTFQGNDLLTSIDGFRSLEVVGWFTVVENRGLSALDLSSLVYADQLRILCNPRLPAELLVPLGGIQGEVTLPGNSTELCP